MPIPRVIFVGGGHGRGATCAACGHEYRDPSDRLHHKKCTERPVNLKDLAREFRNFIPGQSVVCNSCRKADQIEKKYFAALNRLVHTVGRLEVDDMPSAVDQWSAVLVALDYAGFVIRPKKVPGKPVIFYRTEDRRCDDLESKLLAKYGDKLTVHHLRDSNVPAAERAGAVMTGYEAIRWYFLSEKDE